MMAQVPGDGSSTNTEMVDVLTVAGAATGQRKLKSDVHRDGDWHRSVHIWIQNGDGRLLLQKRAAVKENNPGLWDVSVAGHVSAGETPVESALREVQEEIGLTILEADLHHVATIRESSLLNGGRYRDNEVHEIYLIHRDVDLSALTLQPGEVDDVALIPIDELRERVMRHDPAIVPHDDEYSLLLLRLTAVPGAVPDGGASKSVR